MKNTIANRSAPRMTTEALEARRLLAGVTILMHGYNGNITGWVESAADAIAERADGSASQYIMTVSEGTNGRLRVSNFEHTDGPALNQNTSGEAIVKLDWTAVDDGSFSTGEVGEAVAGYLMARHGSVRALAELPIHLIGHSRGASLGVAISGELGLRGIWVDHQTFLDPHPVDGEDDFLGADFGDTPMRVYDNVEFADNYWRTDGNANDFDPDGESVAGAFNRNLEATVQENFVISAHMAVTAYYHGTIDTDASFNGDHPVTGSWYGNTSAKPSRTATGFRYSAIAAGKRPASGTGEEFGGTASRVAIDDAEGVQWPNVAHVRAVSGSTFNSGNRISVRMITEDRDSDVRYTIFLDSDQNPYNGNNAKTMRRVTLSELNDLQGVRISALTDGVAEGNYYIGVQASDTTGRLRVNYSGRVSVTNIAPDVLPVSSLFSSTMIPATKKVTTSLVADVL